MAKLGNQTLYSLEILPNEIVDQICGYLKTSEVSRLSLVSHSVYSVVQSVLYRHLEVNSFESLVLLVRSLNSTDRLPRTRLASRLSAKEIVTLNVTFDRLRRGSSSSSPQPVAVLVSRMLISVSRHCPDINISLSFLNSPCGSYFRFSSETFPRVTKLVLYIGENNGEQGSWDNNPRPRKTSCYPNGGFWSPFVNGTAFPDLKSVEIHHYWAMVPPQGSNLVTQAEACRYPSAPPPLIQFGRYTARYRYRHGFTNETSGEVLTEGGNIGPCPGLEQLEEVYLESPPELNSALLMQILDNKVSKASSLKRLEIRFCRIELQTIANLLQQEITTLKQFTLLIGYKDFDAYIEQTQDPPPPHLCPLLRQFSKNIVEFKFAACHVCREIFFDDDEIQSLKQSGVTNNIGSSRGATENSTNLDRIAVHQVITECRTKKKLNYRNSCTADAIAEAKQKNLIALDSTIKINTELQLDREDQARSRQIKDSTSRWKRSIISWEGLCHGTNEWAELQEGANMEEEGVDWVLTNCKSQLASRHSNGKPEDIIDCREELEEGFGTSGLQEQIL